MLWRSLHDLSWPDSTWRHHAWPHLVRSAWHLRSHRLSRHLRTHDWLLLRHCRSRLSLNLCDWLLTRLCHSRQ